LRQFYVKGGPRSHGQHGFIFSNANWDPYPMANDIEAFTIALANMDVAVTQRINRFSSTFFTVMAPPPEAPGEPGRWGVSQGSGIDAAALMQEITGLINPVAPEGNALISNVEDLQTQTRLKVRRARLAVDDTIDLLAEDLLTGTFWLDLRKAQVPARSFGPVPTAVWSAFRRVIPYQEDPATPLTQPIHELAAAFIRNNAASTFYANNDREPDAVDRRHITE
jgi:histidine ammonia-lyase